MLHYVLLVLSAMIPGGLFFLAFSRLVGFHIGHSIIWGEMRLRYTCAQIKYQMKILGNIAIGCTVLNGISGFVTFLTWFVSGGQHVTGDSVIWMFVCFAFLLTNTIAIMEAHDNASSVNHRSDWP